MRATVETHIYSGSTTTTTGLSFGKPPAIILDAAASRGWAVREWTDWHDQRIGMIKPPGCKIWRAVGHFARTQPGKCVVFRCQQPRG